MCQSVSHSVTVVKNGRSTRRHYALTGVLFTKQRHEIVAAKVSFQTMRKLPSQSDDVEEMHSLYPKLYPGSAPQGIAQKNAHSTCFRSNFRMRGVQMKPVRDDTNKYGRKEGFHLSNPRTYLLAYPPLTNPPICKSRVYLLPAYIYLPTYLSIHLSILYLHIYVSVYIYAYITNYAHSLLAALPIL
jgi:hypothetical protein